MVLLILFYFLFLLFEIGEAFVISVSHAQPLCIGLNCALVCTHIYISYLLHYFFQFSLNLMYTYLLI